MACILHGSAQMKVHTMKKFTNTVFHSKPIQSIFLLLLFLFISYNSDAQLFKNAKKILGSSGSGFTESEAADGIKEALVKGTGESVNLVSIADGYFGNPEIKIPFPEDAKQVETKLRSMGMGKKVDEAILSINRAAEDAAREAKPIFVSAIKGMSIGDAIGIVKGESNAATEYLRKSTTPDLRIKFQPSIKTSLDKVQATKYWSDLINTYNKIPFIQKVNPDLSAYVTGKAIDGLFVMIAKEEKKIRKDPLARTSELLKKVFGN
jgi:hypothetical protein